MRVGVVRHPCCADDATRTCANTHFLLYFRVRLFCQANSRSDEIAEQGMWTIGTALKFWMKLRGHKPGMVRQLDDLDQAIIGGTATDYHTMCLHSLAIFIIELVAMAMTLKDNRFTIGLVGFCTGSEAADPVAQAHGTAFIGHLALRIHQIDDGIGGLRIKFGAVGAFEPQHIAGELDNGHLNPQTEPQVWLVHTTSEVRGLYVAFDTTMTKTAWYHDAIKSFQDLGNALAHFI